MEIIIDQDLIAKARADMAAFKPLPTCSNETTCSCDKHERQSEIFKFVTALEALSTEAENLKVSLEDGLRELL